MHKSITVVAALVLLGTGHVGAESLQTCKNDAVREKPFIDAKVVSTVKTGQVIDVQNRQGSWYFVKVSSKTGWLPMLSARRQKAPSSAVPPAQTGRSSTGGVVNTTGVRGLSEETLKTAAFSEEAVAAAEKYRVLPADAAAFAVAAGVSPQSVPSLAVPPKQPSIPGGAR